MLQGLPVFNQICPCCLYHNLLSVPIPFNKLQHPKMETYSILGDFTCFFFISHHRFLFKILSGKVMYIEEG